VTAAQATCDYDLWKGEVEIQCSVRHEKFDAAQKKKKIIVKMMELYIEFGTTMLYYASIRQRMLEDQSLAGGVQYQTGGNEVVIDAADDTFMRTYQKTFYSSCGVEKILANTLYFQKKLAAMRRHCGFEPSTGTESLSAGRKADLKAKASGTYKETAEPPKRFAALPVVSSVPFDQDPNSQQVAVPTDRENELMEARYTFKNDRGLNENIFAPNLLGVQGSESDIPMCGDWDRVETLFVGGSCALSSTECDSYGNSVKLPDYDWDSDEGHGKCLEDSLGSWEIRGRDDYFEQMQAGIQCQGRKSDILAPNNWAGACQAAQLAYYQVKHEYGCGRELNKHGEKRRPYGAKQCKEFIWDRPNLDMGANTGKDGAGAALKTWDLRGDRLDIAYATAFPDSPPRIGVPSNRRACVDEGDQGWQYVEGLSAPATNVDAVLKNPTQYEFLHKMTNSLMQGVQDAPSFVQYTHPEGKYTFRYEKLQAPVNWDRHSSIVQCFRCSSCPAGWSSETNVDGSLRGMDSDGNPKCPKSVNEGDADASLDTPEAVDTSTNDKIKQLVNNDLLGRGSVFHCFDGYDVDNDKPKQCHEYEKTNYYTATSPDKTVNWSDVGATTNAANSDGFQEFCERWPNNKQLYYQGGEERYYNGGVGHCPPAKPTIHYVANVVMCGIDFDALLISTQAVHTTTGAVKAGPPEDDIDYIVGAALTETTACAYSTATVIAYSPGGYYVVEPPTIHYVANAVMCGIDFGVIGHGATPKAGPPEDDTDYIVGAALTETTACAYSTATVISYSPGGYYVVEPVAETGEALTM
jgi:hypothetical protein